MSTHDTPLSGRAPAPIRRALPHGREWRRRRAQRLGALVGALVGLVFLIPLLWVIGSSLRHNSQMFKDITHLSWRSFIPTAPTLENFAHLTHGAFGHSILNSIIVAAVTVVVGLAVSALGAFALAVIPFRGRGIVFAIVCVSFLVPFDAIAIPLATLFRDWGLQNSYPGLILPGIGNGLAVFLLRQFFLAVPQDLVEAGRLDGLGWWGVLGRIYTPLSIPALIGAGLTIFLFQWQAYLWPLLIGTDSAHTLGPIALANLTGAHTVDYGQVFAGALSLIVLPLLLILRFQRRFTQSISTSGIV